MPMSSISPDSLISGPGRSSPRRWRRSNNRGGAHVILNFKHVTFVDSAAIGLLALASQQFKSTNRKLSLVGVQGTVKQVLNLAHIEQMIPTFASEDLAIGAKAA